MSRAPRPHGTTPRASTASQSAAASSSAEQSSTPSSPVYPVREIMTSTPSSSPSSWVNAGFSSSPSRSSEPRALHGDEAVIVGGVPHLGAAWLALLQPLVDGGAVRGVADDEVLAMRDAVHDHVVDDAAPLVRQERVLGVAVLEFVEVVREHLLQEPRRARPVDVDLAHVRDVEGARIRSDGAMLLDHADVLNGHLVPGEGHDARAESDVALVQRRARERRGLHVGDSIGCGLDHSACNGSRAGRDRNEHSGREADAYQRFSRDGNPRERTPVLRRISPP